MTEFLARAWSHRRLIVTMTQRDVVKRYKGSLLGILWSFVYPILLLAVYTFVFRVIFVSRWDQDGANIDYAVILFAGLIVYNVFSESLAAAPNLIQSNVSYVKKVVFPLEILAYVTVGGALFHAAVSVLVLIVGLIAVTGGVPVTILLLPLIFLPLTLMCLGLIWLFSSLGVYLRDVGQIVSVGLVLLMFMSPILYPVSAIPEQLRPWLAVNPLTPILEQTRAVAVMGVIPDPLSFLISLTTGFLCAWLGFTWFQKTRDGFADVI